MTADQLSVHDNSGRNRRAFPFAVIAQSNRFRASTRRVVVPLLDVHGETFEFTIAPEPATLLLIAGAGLLIRRRRA